MSLFTSTLKVIIILLLLCVPLYAVPIFLEGLQADPMLKPGFPTDCGTCHVNPNGGGERNRFGRFFESQLDRITPLLRARDGVKFVYPIIKVSDAITIHFSDPEKKQFVIEMPERKFIVVDVKSGKVLPNQ